MCVCVGGTLQWTGVLSKLYSHHLLPASFPGVSSRSTTNLTRIKRLLKMNELTKNNLEPQQFLHRWTSPSVVPWSPLWRVQRSQMSRIVTNKLDSVKDLPHCIKHVLYYDDDDDVTPGGIQLREGEELIASEGLQWVSVVWIFSPSVKISFWFQIPYELFMYPKLEALYRRSLFLMHVACNPVQSYACMWCKVSGQS